MMQAVPAEIFVGSKAPLRLQGIVRRATEFIRSNPSQVRGRDRVAILPIPWVLKVCAAYWSEKQTCYDQLLLFFPVPTGQHRLEDIINDVNNSV